jgi:hypothetical protein
MAISDKNEANDLFWLNMGAEVIYNSVQTRREAVTRLQQTIVWVFGVYTSISFASVVFSDKKHLDSTALILFGFAFAFLILAYWLATVAAFPALEAFYPNAVASIRTALTEALKKNSRWFNSAMALSGVGTLLYSLAILMQFASPAFHPSKPVVADIAITINAIKTSSMTNRYSISMASKKNAWHEVLLIHSMVNKKTMVDTIPMSKDTKNKSLFVLTDSMGIARFTLPELKDETGNSLLIIRIDSVKGDELIYTKKIKYKIN